MSTKTQVIESLADRLAEAKQWAVDHQDFELACALRQCQDELKQLEPNKIKKARMPKWSRAVFESLPKSMGFRIISRDARFFYHVVFDNQWNVMSAGRSKTVEESTKRFDEAMDDVNEEMRGK